MNKYEISVFKTNLSYKLNSKILKLFQNIENNLNEKKNRELTFKQYDNQIILLLNSITKENYENKKNKLINNLNKINELYPLNLESIITKIINNMSINKDLSFLYSRLIIDIYNFSDKELILKKINYFLTELLDSIIKLNSENILNSNINLNMNLNKYEKFCEENTKIELIINKFNYFNYLINFQEDIKKKFKEIILFLIDKNTNYIDECNFNKILEINIDILFQFIKKIQKKSEFEDIINRLNLYLNYCNTNNNIPIKIKFKHMDILDKINLL